MMVKRDLKADLEVCNKATPGPKLGKVGGAVPPGSGGGGAGSGGTAPKPAGCRQVAEITGPTRDLLTDLLSPLAHLGQIVAPIQDIRQILYELEICLGKRC